MSQQPSCSGFNPFAAFQHEEETSAPAADEFYPGQVLIIDGERCVVQQSENGVTEVVPTPMDMQPTEDGASHIASSQSPDEGIAGSSQEVIFTTLLPNRQKNIKL